MRTIDGVEVRPSFQRCFRTKRPTIYDRAIRPNGDFKANYWFDKDGEDHEWAGAWSNWGNEPGSRSGGIDLQTYSNTEYNGIDPFSMGPDGLVITARPNVPSAKTPKAFTSGFLSTEKSFLQRYGYFEADMQFEAKAGLWPHFCLYGQPFTGYAGDEIDIVEHLGVAPGKLWTNYHLKRIGREGNITITGDFTGRMNTFGLLWTPFGLSWWLNGVRVRQVDNPADGFHRPMLITLGLAVGGWDGNEKPAKDLAGSMTVGGLRAYSLA